MQNSYTPSNWKTTFGKFFFSTDLKTVILEQISQYFKSKHLYIEVNHSTWNFDLHVTTLYQLNYRKMSN